MATIDKLNDIKSQTSALLTYANGITGASDTRLGDAVRTLAAGCGHGLDWHTTTQIGDGSTAIVFSGLPITPGSLYILEISSNASGKPSPEVMVWASICQMPNWLFTRGEDTGGGGRNPSVTRTPAQSTIRISSTRAFGADVEYTAKYAEFTID